MKLVLFLLGLVLVVESSGTEVPEVKEKREAGIINIHETLARIPKCDVPRLTAVRLSRPLDPTVSYYPPCLDLPRCGGCSCELDMLECAPTASTFRTYEVFEVRLNSNRGDKVYVQLEEHLSCGCRCIVKEEDCHPTKHIYDKDSCLCRCKERARTCTENQIWSEKECSCICPYAVPSCLDEEFFNVLSCRCEWKCESAECDPGYQLNGYPAEAPVITGLSVHHIPGKRHRQAEVMVPKEE